MRLVAVQKAVPGRGRRMRRTKGVQRRAAELAGPIEPSTAYP
jgi:hypothetical protein